jgi:menaquinone-dependent protoporphyrinogen IX oxidase
VTYYSRDGHTRRVAQDIASQLQADLEELADQTNRRGLMGWLFGGRDAMKKKDTVIGKVSRNPAEYDLVIVGTPVWAWAMTPAVRAYLAQFKGQFKDLAYIVTSGNANPDRIVKTMDELSGKPARGFVSLVQRDFGNEQVYRDKLTAFVSLIRSAVQA